MEEEGTKMNGERKNGGVAGATIHEVINCNN
jgi:hypothetical protein